MKHRILTGIVLGQQRICAIWHIAKPLFQFLNLEAKFAHIEPDLLQIPAFRGPLKVPGGERQQVRLNLFTVEI
ncbi:hypothetical protein [Chryseolinea soli]|uniref:hypothetical protein n=1 Tax=Chryseolinea soli TaxID=2321403 RepID=UPI0013591356|nr:hypothetical protein [Chryseolinea soli]